MGTFSGESIRQFSVLPPFSLGKNYTWNLHPTPDMVVHCFLMNFPRDKDITTSHLVVTEEIPETIAEAFFPCAMNDEI